MTVIETEEFLDRAAVILSDDERESLVAHLAANPEAGKVVPGTGGVRKIRWAAKGQGKRGGAVIYYYYNQSIRLFLLDLYAKNEKTDLSEGEKRVLQRLLPVLVLRYKKRN